MTTQEKDNYYMDMENSALDKWPKLIIKGKMRILNKEWLEHIKKYIDYGCGLDIAMEEYIEWVLQGGGDEWFEP